jgi:hypothetical protein
MTSTRPSFAPDRDPRVGRGLSHAVARIPASRHDPQQSPEVHQFEQMGRGIRRSAPVVSDAAVLKLLLLAGCATPRSRMNARMASARACGPAARLARARME